MFLSDDEVEEDNTDEEKHLDMEKSDCDPRPQDSLKVATKGDLNLEEASMDDTEVLDELQREDNKHMEVIKVEDVEGLLKEKCDICGQKVAHLEKHIPVTHKEEI